MKLRDKILYMTYGAGLVVLGMVLNSFLVDDADAQGSSLDMDFRLITCRGLIIQDENGKWRGAFGLDSDGDGMLTIYGDDTNTQAAYLGGNADKNDEMMLKLQSKSKTDKRRASMMIDGNGGRFDAVNKMGENVARIGVGSDGGGIVGTYDKFGYRR